MSELSSMGYVLDVLAQVSWVLDRYGNEELDLDGSEPWDSLDTNELAAARQELSRIARVLRETRTLVDQRISDELTENGFLRYGYELLQTKYGYRWEVVDADAFFEYAASLTADELRRIWPKEAGGPKLLKSGLSKAAVDSFLRRKYNDKPTLASTRTDSSRYPKWAATLRHGDRGMGQTMVDNVVGAPYRDEQLGEGSDS